MVRCSCKRSQRDSADEDELGEAAAKATRQTNRKVLWVSLAIGSILVLTSILIAGTPTVAAYLFVASAIAGGYFVGYCVQTVFLLPLQTAMLSANAKSALRVFDGPLLLAAWLSSIFMAVEVALPSHISTSQMQSWERWLSYCFVLNALWFLRRTILRTVVQSLVKRIVGEQLNKMLFINEGMQRLTDAEAAARDRRAQDKAFKNISNILKEANFEEKSHWAQEAFMTLHAPANMFPASKSADLAGPHSYNTLGEVQSLKLLKIIARITFQRLVNEAADGEAEAKATSPPSQSERAGSIESFAKKAGEVEQHASSNRKLIPKSSFRADKPSGATVVPTGRHLSVSVSQSASTANVGSKHMLRQVGAAWAGPLMARMDTSENNSLSEDEFVDGMVRLYHEFYDTKKAALGDSPMAGAASVVIDFVNTLIAIACLQVVAGVQLSEFVVTFAAIGLGLSFAVGSSIDACVRAFQLVTIIAPFSVGDRVILPGYNDNKIMDVSKVDLLVSEFRDADTGVPVIIPNSEILSGSVKNLSRSALVKAVIVFRFRVSNKMTQAHLDELRGFVQQYLKERPMDWVLKQRIRMKPDSNGVKVKVKLNHHRSLRATQARNARGDVFVAINDKLRAMGLMYAEPVQPVALVPSRDVGWDNAAPAIATVSSRSDGAAPYASSSGVSPARLSPIPSAAPESPMAAAGQGTENPVVFRKAPP